ncbi:MAG: hypothetical protein Q4G44_09255 [Alcaligenaceae bacterium]|nr:hypothetical protein [Alcaligenaceae bacterium]
MERTSHIGFYIGLAVWLLAFCLVIKYYFLPDSAIVQLKKAGKVVRAEIIGDSHYAFSGLMPLSSQSQGVAREEQFRKQYTDRQLEVRFSNLSDTLITHVFSMPVDYLSSASLEQIIETQNQSLAIEYEDDAKAKASLPVWLNTKAMTQVFALANEHGRVTSGHIKLGLCLIVITLLQMILPVLYVVQTTQHLSDDVLTLFNTVTVWHWAPLANIIALWIYHSHNSVEAGPNGMPVDVIKLSGCRSTTESITWKHTHYSSDEPAYRVDVTYKDTAGQLNTLHFTETVSAIQKIKLDGMPQHRSILYLENQKDKIVFADRDDGQFI